MRSIVCDAVLLRLLKFFSLVYSISRTIMLAPVLALSWATAALASPGYVKLDLEHEQGPVLVKRQTNTDDLSQSIVAGENGSVRESSCST